MKKMFSKVSIVSFLAIAIMLVTMLALPCARVQADNSPQCWAVIVGISDYQYEDKYYYADNNANELCTELSATWGSDNVRLLTNSQATKSDILSAIKWLADKAAVNDTVFIYFATRHAKNAATGCICPYNFNLSGFSDGITTSELANAIKPIKAGKIAIILECPGAGDFKYALSDSGRVIMMACGSDESIWSSGTLGHQIFTYYVLQAFYSFDYADTNNNHELSAEEIFEYASSSTTDYEINRSLSPVQHPGIDDRCSGELPLLAELTFTTNPIIPSGTNILTLDGINYSSAPVTELWIPGSTHTMTISQIVNKGSDTRYVFTGWKDGDTSTSRTVSKGSYTADYQKEYLLTINSASGNPVGGGWYKDGSTATFSVTDYIETSDTKHYFTGWSGDYVGTSSSSSLVMNGPKTVTATWRNEYLLTVNSAFGNPVGAGWYKEGSTATFSVKATVETSDAKHYFTNWSGDYWGTSASGTLVMSGPKTVTTGWRNEYLLTINSDYGQPTGAGWYNEGEKVNISITSEQGFIVRHMFTGWSGALTSPQPSTEIIMNSPATVTANWQADFVQLYILIGAVVVLGAGITVTVIIIRRRSTSVKSTRTRTKSK
jgi:hypothetical protein